MRRPQSAWEAEEWPAGWQARLPDQASRSIAALQGAVNAVAALRTAEEGWLAYCVGATGTLKIYSLRTGLQVQT